jgi:ATP-binding cassette subfamily F protein 3
MIEIKTILSEILPQIDDHTLEYFYTLITENGSLSDENIIQETLVPFIESYGLVDSENEAIEMCKNLIKRIKSSGIDSSNKANKIDDIQLLDKVVSMSVSANTTFSKTEKATLDVLWGFDQIRNKRNDTIQTSEAGSARYERKAVKDQKRWLNDLEKEFHNSDHENDDIQISSMMLPDFSGKNNEKDIQVNNITISFAGKLLLEGADIRIVYGRRYGLIGKNGVGKTTLLRHMANFDIEGFPRHHRILHVKQVNSNYLII